FHVNLSQNQIRRSTPEEIDTQLRNAAMEQIDKRDAGGLEKYLVPLYAENELANWAREKFGIEITGQEIADAATQGRSPATSIAELLETRARESYARRDIEYPVSQALLYAFNDENGSTDNPYAADWLKGWIKAKYGVELPVDYIRSRTVRQLHDELCKLQDQFMHTDRLAKEIDQIMKSGDTRKAQLIAFNERFGMTLK